MAVGILQSPDDLSLAKNQVIYKINSNTYISSNGGEYSTSLTLNSVPANGETLILEFLGLQFTYTFLDSPTPGSCYEIDRSGTVADVQGRLYDAFTENHYLERYYLHGVGVGIQANLVGSEYNISFSGTAYGKFNQVGIAGADKAFVPTYGVRWDLYIGEDIVADPSTYVVGQLIQLDESAQAFIDMKDLLEKRLSPDVPTHASAALQYNLESIKKFKIRHGEFYDGKINCYKSEDPKLVMLAGIGLDRWPWVNFPNTYGNGFSGQKFLTNIPSGVKVDRSSQVFLSLLVPANFDILVDIRWDDGTDTNRIVLNNVAGNAKTMVIIPCGFDARNMIANKPVDATNALYYEIYVEDDSANASEKYRFYLDNIPKLYPRRMIMHNSLNGWDTIYTSGDQTRALDNSGDEYRTEVPRLFKTDSVELDRIESPVAEDDPEQIRLFKLNTGYRSKSFIQALARELPLSKKILLDTGTHWQEIRVDKASVKEIDNDSDDLWSLTFNYTLGLVDKAY